ncbi:MAG: FAD-dependent oxidoreductase [Lachnospiraceae bacterium]|nr:FAD-dependent oxidoreductase [Lachnospiraceae bacterium]
MKLALSPGFIGTCRIRNRFVMPAANLGWCTDGFVSEKVVSFYQKRARGGTGLIIAGAAGVDPVRINRAGMMQICDDRFIPAMERLVRAVHKEDGKIFLQLMHAGAYAGQEEHGGLPAVAPSRYFCNFTRETTEELTKAGISQIISWFRDGAVRAQKAGFDGIELIGSAGYLIAEFLSGATNKRQDEYGGTISGRGRFLMDVIDAVREGVGEDYPVILRLSGSDMIPEGNGPEELAAIAKAVGNHVDALNITGGWHESQVPQITYHVPRGMYLYLAKAVKELVDIPVIGCNRLDAESAADAVEQGCCDMVGVLRGLIADPDLVNKYKAGETDAIRPCLGCNQQCLERIFSGEPLACTVNPFVGREAESLRLRQEGKKILVIGAGISGMVYAALNAVRNRVTVWEKDLHYGGAARAVAKLPDREDVRDYLDYLFRRCISLGVVFKWEKEGCPEELKTLLDNRIFDQIVIAVGSSMDMSGYRTETSQPASGCRSEETPLVLTAGQAILAEELKGRHIVIAGSGYKAVQTAQYCALARKKGDREKAFLDRFIPEHSGFASHVMGWKDSTVTLLGWEKRIGSGFGKSTRWIMLKETERQGIFIELDAAAEKICRGRIVYRTGDVRKEIPCDLMVICQGWKANEDFDSMKAEYTDRLVLIGDARRPGRITEAVKDAFTAAIMLQFTGQENTYRGQ